jgi:hypothetical protein
MDVDNVVHEQGEMNGNMFSLYSEHLYSVTT